VKTKLLIATNIILLIVVLIFAGFYLKNKSNDTITGSYQSKDPASMVQLVIDGDKFTEYLENKQIDTGSITKSETQKDTYILTNGKESYFAYKDGKDILYFKANKANDVISLNKILDVPTYISHE